MRILAIPDTQTKPGVSTDHIEWAARFAKDKRFDAIVILGDWWDFPSLSSYDRGKLASHGRFVEDDIDAGNRALERFENVLKPVAKSYDPIRIFIAGNHEERLVRHVEEHPELAKTLTRDRFHLDRFNWKFVPFLRPYLLSGVAFVHYCALNANGTVSNGKHGCDAAAQGRRMMRSTVSGHRQGIDIKYLYTPTKIITSVVAGSFHAHDEKYLTEQGRRFWRGVVALNDVRKNGEFDVCPVSLSYLGRKYG